RCELPSGERSDGGSTTVEGTSLHLRLVPVVNLRRKLKQDVQVRLTNPGTFYLLNPRNNYREEQFTMSNPVDWHNASALPGRAHSYLFAQALRHDSNLAMDWLWLATQLDDEDERQYCMQRAHYIDPNSIAVPHLAPGLIGLLKSMVESTLKKRT